ncbi:MAG: LysR family substrate-binding domain-containing protein [Mycobacterium sp.]|nr:LysR family substrate-binding domain-containing protein [Mycobacterium sp.]
MTALRLTVGYVAGVTPAKWARTWAERHPEVPLLLQAISAAGAAEALRAGAVDVALLRPPVDTSGLALINLYEETTTVVVPTDHLFSAVDTVAVADLDGEPILIPRDNVVAWADDLEVQVDQRPETTKDAIELVAAGIGALIVPQSLARLHHRKDLIFRQIADAPTCPVALAVPEDQQSTLVEEFIGIVRGRKPNSSRGRSEPVPKRTAREKTLAKQAARAAAGKVARKPGRAGRGRR